MVFTRYFYRLFFTTFFGISVVLSLLYNFIEFFEKLLSVQHATFSQIVYFTSLNMVPTFARMWPVACWLTTCMVVRELWQRGEWQTLQLLGVERARLLRTFFGVGLVMLAIAVPLYEVGVLTAVDRAEKFRKETFKGGVAGRLIATWLMLDEHLFCYIGFLEPTASGKDIILVYRNADGSLAKLLTAPTFSLDYELEQLTLHDGQYFVATSCEQKILLNETLSLPSLFLRLSMQHEQPSLFILLQRLFFYRDLLAFDAWHALLAAMIERLLFYLQIACFPFLTAGIFIICQRYVYAKWFAILLIYPIIAFLSLVILCVL
ncbi:LptF/LptG family permease [bacterium]|nr:MAG: LptF/LptG family permease [bacterium]